QSPVGPSVFTESQPPTAYAAGAGQRGGTRRSGARFHSLFTAGRAIPAARPASRLRLTRSDMLGLTGRGARSAPRTNGKTTTSCMPVARVRALLRRADGPGRTTPLRGLAHRPQERQAG